METKKLLQNDSLWNRLQEFSLDAPNVDFPFSKKLAKEENWSIDFTKKAIEEYKKFVYLCCTLPNGASPSEIVDKVWHMHLIYTQNYWEEFCPNILKKKLHHHPSKGGFAEKDKHHHWFSDTLKNYRDIFNQDAPEDIWSNENKPRRVNWLKKLRLIPFFILFLILTSCSDGILSVFSITFLGLLLFSIFISAMNAVSDADDTTNDRNKNNDSGSGCGGGGGSCSGGCGGGCGGCGGCGG